MSKPFDGVPPTEWAKHLKPRGKKAFWRKVRRKAKKELKDYEKAQDQQRL